MFLPFELKTDIYNMAQCVHVDTSNMDGLKIYFSDGSQLELDKPQSAHFAAWYGAVRALVFGQLQAVEEKAGKRIHTV